MADLLTDIRRDIDRRLDELRPVLDEFRQLEHARDALAQSDGRPPRRALGEGCSEAQLGLRRPAQPE